MTRTELIQPPKLKESYYFLNIPRISLCNKDIPIYDTIDPHGYLLRAYDNKLDVVALM